MNKKVILPVACFLAIAGSASFSLLTNPNYQSVSAYSISSLPTTINLNDVSSTDIRNYYSELNSLENSERTGTNLLKNLKTILKKDQKYYSYDSGDSIWKMYEITDRDWEKSPASSITYGTYDPVSNTITGYQYGSNNDAKNNPYVHALYINRNVENETKAWGNHKQDMWGINQEHVWAKSQGFDTKGSNSSGGARGDPMHLIAGNGYSNNIHLNYYYGNVDRTKIDTDCGAKYSNQQGNLRGISKTIGSGTVFEPQDSDKGDIARAIFYMAARYNYISGSDSDGIDGNNPNLEIVNNSDYSPTGYTSSTTVTGKMGVLSDLLEWNKLDPVDEYEIHRNNLLFNNYTNNRNPFIDFPSWADYIWGADSGVKFANPVLDRINGSGLSVSKNRIELEPDKTTTVTATTTDNSGVTWSITDSTIAELSKTSSASGETITIKALKEGETKVTVTATIDSEEVTAEITIVVAKKPFVFGLSTTHIIIIGAVAGVVITGAIIFFLLPNSRAKRRISKKVQQTVKNATKSSSSSSKKSSKSTSKKKKK